MCAGGGGWAAGGDDADGAMVGWPWEMRMVRADMMGLGLLILVLEEESRGAWKVLVFGKYPG